MDLILKNFDAVQGSAHLDFIFSPTSPLDEMSDDDLTQFLEDS